MPGASYHRAYAPSIRWARDYVIWGDTEEGEKAMSFTMASQHCNRLPAKAENPAGVAKRDNEWHNFVYPGIGEKNLAKGRK